MTLFPESCRATKQLISLDAPISPRKQSKGKQIGKAIYSVNRCVPQPEFVIKMCPVAGPIKYVKVGAALQPPFKGGTGMCLGIPRWLQFAHWCVGQQPDTTPGLNNSVAEFSGRNPDFADFG
jgi:hypothetical protein